MDLETKSKLTSISGNFWRIVNECLIQGVDDEVRLRLGSEVKPSGRCVERASGDERKARTSAPTPSGVEVANMEADEFYVRPCFGRSKFP